MSGEDSDEGLEATRLDPRHAPRDYHAIAPAFPEQGLDLTEVVPALGPGAQIELEVGFGRGMFLCQRNSAAPEAYLIGIEIKRKWAYRVARRCEREGRQRVRVFAGDIRAALPLIRPDAAIARAFLHFPDPWWKKRHSKRRLVGDAILEQLARLLRPGGEFYVQTDVEERALEHLQALEAHPAFSVAEGGLLDENPYGARSNREQRAIEDGLPVYRVLAHRVAD